MTPDQIAGYRVALKRIIRAAIGVVVNEAPTRTLESQVRTAAALKPAIVARSLARLFETAAQAWTRGNNSGDNPTMKAAQLNCDLLRERAERVLKLWSVRVDYPGLYPSFEWNGEHYYDTERLLRDIAANGLWRLMPHSLGHKTQNMNKQVSPDQAKQEQDLTSQNELAGFSHDAQSQPPI